MLCLGQLVQRLSSVVAYLDTHDAGADAADRFHFRASCHALDIDKLRRGRQDAVRTVDAKGGERVEALRSIDVPSAVVIACALLLSYWIVRALVAVIDAEDASR